MEKKTKQKVADEAMFNAAAVILGGVALWLFANIAGLLLRIFRC